jgi:hypothetical protein
MTSRTAARMKYQAGPVMPNIVPNRAASAPRADITRAKPRTKVRE